MGKIVRGQHLGNGAASPSITYRPRVRSRQERRAKRKHFLTTGEDRLLSLEFAQFDIAQRLHAIASNARVRPADPQKARALQAAERHAARALEDLDRTLGLRPRGCTLTQQQRAERIARLWATRRAAHDLILEITVM